MPDFPANENVQAKKVTNHFSLTASLYLCGDQRYQEGKPNYQGVGELGPRKCTIPIESPGSSIGDCAIQFVFHAHVLATLTRKKGKICTEKSVNAFCNSPKNFVTHRSLPVF